LRVTRFEVFLARASRLSSCPSSVQTSSASRASGRSATPFAPRHRRTRAGGDEEDRHQRPLERTVPVIGIEAESPLDPVGPRKREQRQRTRKRGEDRLTPEANSRSSSHRNSLRSVARACYGRSSLSSRSWSRSSSSSLQQSSASPSQQPQAQRSHPHFSHP